MEAGGQELTGGNFLTLRIYRSADPERNEEVGSIEGYNQEYQNKEDI